MTARLPGLQAVRTGQPSLDRFLEAVRERLEVREGARGDPLEAAVTWRDLRTLGISAPSPVALPNGKAGFLTQQSDGTYVAISADELVKRLSGSPGFGGSTAPTTSNDGATAYAIREAVSSIIGEEIAKRSAGDLKLEATVAEVQRAIMARIQELTDSIGGPAATGGSAGTQYGTINARAYGVVGNGSANDTTKMQKALDDAIAGNRNLYIPAGTYICANLSYSSNSAAIRIFGDSNGNTILKNNIDTNPVMTISAASGNPSQITISDIKFLGNGSVSSWGGGTAATNNLVGTRPTNTSALKITNGVWINIDNCFFQGAIIGLELYGGIVITLTRCYALYNDKYGYKIWGNTTGSLSPSGIGWPNAITLRDCHAGENGWAGLYFDCGRLLTVDGGNYEGNGKNTTIATTIACGIYIGPNTGCENGATAGPNGTPYHTIAATIRHVWFEQNGNNASGVPNSNDMAHIVHNHGILHVEDCIGTNVTAGRYFRINGGQYHINNFSCEGAVTTTTYYVDEGATSGISNLVYWNTVDNVHFNTPGAGAIASLTATNMRIDPTKTIVDGRRFDEKQVQSGSGTTSSGVLSVTFPKAFLVTPNVIAQVVTNDSNSNTYEAEVYNNSTTGVSIRAKSRDSAGTVTTGGALTVSWVAVSP